MEPCVQQRYFPKQKTFDKIQIDYEEFGLQKITAQRAKLYKPADLINKQVICDMNFLPKQITNIMSECLILGAIGNKKEVILIQPERKVKNGLRIA